MRTPIGRHGGALRSVRPDDLAALVVARRRRAQRHRPGPHRRRHPGQRQRRRRGEPQRGAHGGAAGRPARGGGRPDHQPPLRLRPAGRQQRRPRHHGRRRRRHGRRRRRVDDPGAHRAAQGGDAPSSAARPQVADTTLGWRFVNPRLDERYPAIPLGETAELVAERWGVSREDQDAFALRQPAACRGGHRQRPLRRAAGARGDPAARRGARPRRPRRASPGRHHRGGPGRPEAGLPGGRQVTAGNSSGINDGAAALVLVEAGRARELGLRPLARVVSTAVAGVDPVGHGHGPGAGHAQGARAGRPRRSPTSTSSSSTRPSPASRSPASASWGSIRHASTSTAGPSRWAIRWA